MKLLIGVGVLFGALTLQVLYTEGGLGGGDVGTLKEKLDELQDELGLLREELYGLKLNLLKKSKIIIKLQTDMGKLRSERASTPQLSLNLREGLLAEKRLRENTEIDLRELKTVVRQNAEKRENTEIDLGELKTVVRQNAEKISALQIDTARLSKNNQSLCQCSTISGKITGLKCDPCMPGLPGQEGETDRRGENGTRPERVAVPELRFTRADGRSPEHVVIEARGAAVRDRDGPKRAEWITVRTDGLFPAGHRVYWETRLVWSQEVSDHRSGWWWVGSVGVRREGSHFRTYPGWDDQSWGVWIEYDHIRKRWRYECHHGGKPIFSSAPLMVTSPSVSLRLGFLLDPGARTLTAVDVNTNTLIYTFSLPAGDAGSQRLVPVVAFGNPRFERRFSLAGVDPSRLPGAVTDLLQN